ncbi:hypothetical protein AB0F91_18960 [Amycolatopsis sp. NPDC023774]|uniref:hypothetical protein n=1 Tax=Amycolatopsis sp. NPDC023774 TaxID=3155015 RepID=UPI0033FF4E74
MALPAPESKWLTGLNFTITGDQPAGGGASGGAAAAPAGPGFSLSPDEARSMLTVAKRVRDQLRDMRIKANRLTALSPPADEPGSTGYNKLLVGDGQSTGAFGYGNESVKREYAYAAELVDRLEKALGITESADEQAGTDIKNAGSQEQGKGLA